MSICPTVPRPKCHVDDVTGIAHWFGNVGLWEITVACAVGESFERPTMPVAITTYVEPRAIAVVWGWKMDPFCAAR